MARVLFFEKPGCIGNGEQKRLLRAAGHQLEVRSLLADPLLVRRPLMRVGEERRAGFDPAGVDAWIGLTPAALGRDLESCPSTGGEFCDATPA